MATIIEILAGDRQVDSRAVLNTNFTNLNSAKAELAGTAGGQTLIGGTAVTDIMKIQGTSGDGTLTSPSIQWLVGNNGATIAMTALNNGNIGIGVVGPTASMHIKAGTATAGTAPIKLDSGTLNTTPEAGAIEFLTDDYYATITTGAARKRLALIPTTTSPDYTTSNVSAGRTLDANATTINELADIVGTLIADLQATNILI